jgi:hypothetical protein
MEINENLTKEKLKSLGLAGSIGQLLSSSISVKDSIIDSNFLKNDPIIGYKLDLKSEGAIRDPSPVAIIEKPVELKNYQNNDERISISKIKKISSEKELFLSKYEYSETPAGEVSFVNFDKTLYKTEDNNFFNNFHKKNQNEKVNNDFEFGRFRFPGGSHNTTSLKIQSKTGELILNPSGNTKDEQRKKYLNWNVSQGISNTFSGFYIPYPNTIDLQNFYKYNIPLKLSSKIENNQLNGIIAISTGNGTDSKICYLSQHSISTGYLNTFENINHRNGLKSTKVIQVKSIIIDSSNVNDGNVLGSSYSYEDYLASGQYFDGSGGTIELKSGIHTASRRILTSNSYLSQSTPIKDTDFYKVYKNLYTGKKGINTGVWNGIIPSGTNFTVELISTTLNKQIGLNDSIGVYYSNIGSGDATDLSINKSTLIDQIKIENKKINAENLTLSYNAYGEALTNGESVKLSKNKARRKIQKAYNKSLKINASGVIKENSNFKKNIIFASGLRNAKSNFSNIKI